MVVKLIKWPLWPPTAVAKKFLVKLVVGGLHGFINLTGRENDRSRIVTEVRWKGSKSTLMSLRKSNRTNLTKVAPLVVWEEGIEEDEEEDKNLVAKVEWNEEFVSVCTFTSNNIQKPNLHPWEIEFQVSDGPRIDVAQKMNKVHAIGAASLNLAQYASATENKEIQIRLPLKIKSAKSTIKPVLYLHLVLSISEVKQGETSSEIIRNESGLIPSTPSSPLSLPLPPLPPVVHKSENHSGLKAGLRKANIFRGFSFRHKKNGSLSEDGYIDINDDDEEEDVDAIGYESLAYANYIGFMMFYEMRSNSDFDSWVYYSGQRKQPSYYMDCFLCSNVEKKASLSSSFSSSVVEFNPPSSSSFSFSSSAKSLGQSLLPWKRKRPVYIICSECEGEPLLKKSDGQMDEVTADKTIFEFEEWETNAIRSRDYSMKLRSQMFFASIDQRSECASGASACTALVTVMAHWLNTNVNRIPSRSNFDSLIREGSLEWRKLCENELYIQQFPDKHFDLDTVLQVKIRPLSVVPSKSFVGFFHPKQDQQDDEDDNNNDDGGDNNSDLEFLDGLMSFDNIWDEIKQAASTLNTPLNQQQLYIVSWNDHFFILVVRYDAYYIIDTLGERLYEGCKQAYILKFDESTSIGKISSSPKMNGSNEKLDENKSEEIICRGKETCKEYIKSFLAAIPIKSVRVDMKKGVNLSTIYQTLQIEFHFTELSAEIH